LVFRAVLQRLVHAVPAHGDRPQTSTITGASVDPHICAGGVRVYKRVEWFAFL